MKGGLFHGFQLWVNLPRAMKMANPRYQDINASAVSLVSTDDGGALLRIIAGDVAGHSGPGITHTPITLVHATITPGAQARIPWRRDFNALAYVLSGDGTVGANSQPIRTGQLAVFGDGDAVTLRANQQQDARHSNGLDVLLLGGLPIREPVAWAGPFVMNTSGSDCGIRGLPAWVVRPGSLCTRRTRPGAGHARGPLTPYGKTQPGDDEVFAAGVGALRP